VCLCVLARSRVQVSLSPPYLRFIYVHVQPCYAMGLACVHVVPGLLKMWGVVVLGMGEVWMGLVVPLFPPLVSLLTFGGWDRDLCGDCLCPP